MRNLGVNMISHHEFALLGIDNSLDFTETLCGMLVGRDTAISKEDLLQAAYQCTCAGVPVNDILILMHVMLNDMQSNAYINNIERITQLTLVAWSIYHSKPYSVIDVYTKLSYAAQIYRMYVTTWLEKCELYMLKFQITGTTLDDFINLLISKADLKEWWKVEQALIEVEYEKYLRKRYRFFSIPYKFNLLIEKMKGHFK